MINYDSFSRCHLTDFHAGAKELKICEGKKMQQKLFFLRNGEAK